MSTSRRITKPTARPAGDTASKTGATSLSWQDTTSYFRHAITSKRCRIMIGVVVISLVLMVGIAYISFFFTGGKDFSILEQETSRRLMRKAIQNAMGLPGAIVSRWLVDSAFGIISITAIAACGIWGAWLIYPFRFPHGRMFFITLFSLIWGSTVLGFVQYIAQTGSFFRWGGAHGTWLAELAISYVRPWGLILILIAALVIFLILIDKHFITNCHRLVQWVTHLTVHSPVSSQEPEPETQETGQESVINIDLSDTPFHTSDTDKKDEIPITIEKPAPEPEIETPNQEEKPSSHSGSTSIDITSGQAVELVRNQEQESWTDLPPYDPKKDLEYYKFPSIDLLKVYENDTTPVVDRDEQKANANRIVTTLRNFDIEIESIKATVGPTVTLYEIVPKAGIKIAKIQNLESDIMLSLAAKGIRIIAPMPGKGTIGIEVPNEKPQIVSMHSVVASKRFQEEKKMKLPVVIGRTITNEVFMFDLAKTPHLLVAGATGQGKSVAINAIITSLLYKKHPAELKFVLVDPKMVEFAPYKGMMKHYLASMPDTDPNKIIITDCQDVTNVLNSLVIEMENRYKLLMDAGVRNLEEYNDKFISRRLNPEKVVEGSLHHRFLPYIVIIIDEYGDFIMQVGKQVETPIARITQKARAVGMHMILATQRPSVNIVTGVIKANIPTRIALRTQSVVDSRTVLDSKGADQLVGRGDMLYSGNGDITRIQCALVDTPEVDAIVDYIQTQQHYLEPYPLPEYIPEGSEGEPLAPGSVDTKHLDPMFADIARYVVSKQEGSTSRLQRAFEIGYNRAGKLSDQLEAMGIVGPNKGPKGRDVLIQDMDVLNEILAGLNNA